MANSGGSVAPVISTACRTIGGSGSRARQLNVNTAYMCGRSLADRCQRAGCDARYSPLAGLPRSNGTTASRHRRLQVPLSRDYRRAMPPAIAGAGERQLAPIRRPPPWRAATPRRRCAPSLVAARQIGKHHAIATAAAIDQNAVSRRVTHASHIEHAQPAAAR